MTIVFLIMFMTVFVVMAMVILFFSSKTLHTALEKNNINNPESLCATLVFFGLFLFTLTVLLSIFIRAIFIVS